MRDTPRGRAPDYTDAFLVAGFFNLLWIFIFLWAVVGYWSVLAVGYGLYHLIGHIAKRSTSS